MHRKSAIVIGAGIVGLAITRTLAEKGYSVTVFERSTRAIGASIRNFGMIWPVGQPNGILYERALRSRAIWKNICNEAGLWYNESGSLHLAYDELEWQVLHEIAEANKHLRPVELISVDKTLEKSSAVNPQNLVGALWSPDEMIVEARTVIEILPAYLNKKYGVDFYFNTTITSVDHPKVSSANQTWTADEIYICTGADFETLYPDVFAAHHFTKCKLQMMRFGAEKPDRFTGPSLCGGLSLAHYKSFEVAPSLSLLKKRIEDTLPEYVRWGIHVMISCNAEGELTIGDSHEYGDVFDPFDKAFINDLILRYLSKFALIPDFKLIQTWHGIYPKRTNGETEFILSPAQGVTIVNGLDGAGMTLSFGLAEEIILH